MVVPLYDIRDNGVHDRDPYKMYKPHSTLFSIKLHYGGIFTISPNMKYNNGNITFVDMIDSCDLDNVLEPLACDKDVFLLGITPVAKKLVLDVGKKQTSRKDLEGQSSGKELEGQSSAVGNDGSSQVPRIGKGEEETEVDEERHGEEETEVDEERQGEEETEVEDESDSEDSDYLVDEDNNVDDVDIGMEDFEYNIDEEVEFVGCRDKEQPLDIEEGDAEEIEVLDNDYFESASDSDD
ncbi:hypothetical protein Tco_1478231, partial [Tanacetum coccineum]